MCVYMKITKDKYELPLAVADSPAELAAMTGDSIKTIYSSVSREKRRTNPKYKNHRFLKIEID